MSELLLPSHCENRVPDMRAPSSVRVPFNRKLTRACWVWAHIRLYEAHLADKKTKNVEIREDAQHVPAAILSRATSPRPRGALSMKRPCSSEESKPGSAEEDFIFQPQKIGAIGIGKNPVTDHTLTCRFAIGTLSLST